MAPDGFGFENCSIKDRTGIARGSYEGEKMEVENPDELLYKCKSCKNIISMGFYCLECSNTPSGGSVDYEKLFSNSIDILNTLSKDFKILLENNKLLAIQNGAYKKVLTDNGWEV